jgi:hypothetical protein
MITAKLRWTDDLQHGSSEAMKMFGRGARLLQCDSADGAQYIEWPARQIVMFLSNMDTKDLDPSQFDGFIEDISDFVHSECEMVWLRGQLLLQHPSGPDLSGSLQFFHDFKLESYVRAYFAKSNSQAPIRAAQRLVLEGRTREARTLIGLYGTNLRKYFKKGKFPREESPPRHAEASRKSIPKKHPEKASRKSIPKKRRGMAASDLRRPPGTSSSSLSTMR